jgi:ABC-type enterobactin transport system permease subunit
MPWMPERWKIELVADRLVSNLQKEIGMAQSFFHEGSVLVLVFGILDSWVNSKLTPPVGWFIVSVSLGSYVLALLMEWIARWIFRVWAFSSLTTRELVRKWG